MLRRILTAGGRQLVTPTRALLIAGEDFACNDSLLDYALKAANGAVAFNLLPVDAQRECWEAVFLHGKWRGNVFLPPIGVARGTIAGTPVINPALYFVNVGDTDSEPSAAATAAALAAEVTLANRLRITWTTAYTLSAAYGDTQLASITVTGALRGQNVEAISNTRGRLHYTIENAAGTYTVDCWNGTNLVATGTRTGNGVVSCAEANSSGLTVTATITYTGEVAPGTAWIDVLWPKQYQIHYSQSALSYPRTPEATVYDTGVADYTYLSAALAAGAWNYNVVQVADDGTVEAAPSPPATSPVTLVVPPGAPTITAVTTGLANLLTAPNDLADAAWVKTHVTVTSDDTTGPDGVTLADKLTETDYDASIAQTITATAQRYTASLYLKAGTRTTADIILYNPLAVAATLTILSGSGSVAGSRVSGLDANWTRVQLVTDAAVTAGNLQLLVQLATAAPFNKTIYMADAQLEAGTAASDYGATVARVTFTAGSGATSHQAYIGVDAAIDFATPYAATPPFVDIQLPAAASHNYTTALATLLSDCDSAVATATAAWAQPFTTDFATCTTAVKAAFATYATAIGQRCLQLQIDLEYAIHAATVELAAIATIDDPPWTEQANLIYGAFLGALGNLLEADSTRYVSQDGSRLSLVPLANTATAAAGQLGDVNPVLRVAMRATSAGGQEKLDAITSVEFNATTGVNVAPRPNPANIDSVVATGASLSVTSSVNETEAAVATGYFDIYAVAVGAAITPGSPDASVAAGSLLANVRTATVAYTSATGWKDLVVLTRSAAGTRCVTEARLTLYVGDPDPGAADDVSATAQRSA